MSTTSSEARVGLTPEEISIVEATIEAITSSLPIGLTPTQVVSAASRLTRNAWTQPTTIARRAVALAAENVKIAAGISDVRPDPKDRRFTDDWFQSRPLFRRIAQHHVAFEREVGRLIDDLAMDDKSRLRSELIASIVTSALAPTNTLAGNPAAIKEAGA